MYIIVIKSRHGIPGRARAARLGSRQAQRHAVGEPRHAQLREASGARGPVVLLRPHIRRGLLTSSCYARPTTAPTMPRSRHTAGRPSTPRAGGETTARAAPRSWRRRRLGGAAAPARAAWSTRPPAPRAPDDFRDSSTRALRSREAGESSAQPHAISGPCRALRRESAAGSRPAALLAPLSQRGQRISQCRARVDCLGDNTLTRRGQEAGEHGRMEPANHAARDAAKPTEKATRRCWWTHACGKRPAPYAPDDRPDSSARARCAAREPRNPAACRKRTTLLAAPRCRRRRQPGGATGPACAAWTSHRPAPRASDDVPDCKTPCLYGW